MSYDINIMIFLYFIFFIVVNIICDKVFFVKIMVCVLKLDIIVNVKLDMEEIIVKIYNQIIVLGIRVKMIKYVKIEYIYDNSVYLRIV